MLNLESTTENVSKIWLGFWTGDSYKLVSYEQKCSSALKRKCKFDQKLMVKIELLRNFIGLGSVAFNFVIFWAL